MCSGRGLYFDAGPTNHCLIAKGAGTTTEEAPNVRSPLFILMSICGAEKLGPVV